MEISGRKRAATLLCVRDKNKNLQKSQGFP